MLKLLPPQKKKQSWIKCANWCANFMSHTCVCNNNLMAVFSRENLLAQVALISCPTCYSLFQFFPLFFFPWGKEDECASPLWLLHPKCLFSSILSLEKQLSGFIKSSGMLLSTGRDWAPKGKTCWLSHTVICNSI